MNETLNIANKIKKLIDWLDNEFLEREAVIRGAILSIMSGEHLVMLGPPGTAKSLLARLLCSTIKDGKFFYYLLTKFTTPEEIFGPLSLKALEEDKFERKTEGYLPTAHIAFLDEIFKASSAILNTLLTIINERKFHMGEKVIDVPLLSLFGASNELPEENESLEALYDRFLLRYEVDYVSSDENFARIALGEVGEKSIPEKLYISIDEIKQVQKQVSGVKVPDYVLRDIIEIRNRLFEKGLKSSDRRWKKVIKVLRTSALLNGRMKVDYSDLFLLEHMLWNKPDDKKSVKETIIQVLTEGVRPPKDITKKIQAIGEEILEKAKTDDIAVYISDNNEKMRLKELFGQSLNELLEDIHSSTNILNERRKLLQNQVDKNIFVTELKIKETLNGRIDDEIIQLKNLEKPVLVLRDLLEKGNLPQDRITDTLILKDLQRVIQKRRGWGY